MADLRMTVPDSTAVRVALWRALHLEVDAKPYVFEDSVGIRLIAPEEEWRQRPDMHPQGTAPFRASIVARARYIEDHVEEVSLHGVNQYVLLGSGLDTFAQRKPEIASRLKIFEVEKSSTLEWKRHRLQELGFSFQAGLKYVPVNFEAGTTWWEQLLKSGFNPAEKAIVTSVGVSMYLTKDAIAKTFENMNGLASGSKFIMTFMLPLELVDPEDRLGYERSLKGAQASGTPFISFFSPPEMLQFAASFGFKKTEHFSTKDLTQKYFRERADGLKPSSGEEFLIVTL